MQAIGDRWAIEQNYHDLKEVERVSEVQLRRVWSNVGAFNVRLWVHTLIEVWAWARPAATLSDRSDRPWGRSASTALARGSAAGRPEGDPGRRISAPEGPGAVVGENSAPAGGRDPTGGMRSVSSGKVQLVFENVPLIRSDPDAWGVTLETLGRLGYHIRHSVVCASDFGIPQHRKRLLLIAARTPIEIRCPLKMVPGTVRDAIGSMPEHDLSIPNHVTMKLAPHNLARLQATPPDGGTSKPSGDAFDDSYARMYWIVLPRRLRRDASRSPTVGLGTLNSTGP